MPIKLNLAGYFHLLYFGACLPVVAVIRRRHMLPKDGPLPDRLRFFQHRAVALLVLAGLSGLVAVVQHIPLFPSTAPPLGAVAAGVALYAAMVAFMRSRWRRAVESRSRVVHLFMPSNARERTWWIVVSVLAGVGEEITWRGVQAALATTLTGSLWLAALLCSVAFATTHILQGWRSAVIIGVIALAFHTLAWLAGSLYVAMLVHVAYDITAGLAYGKLGRELAPNRLAAAVVLPPNEE